MCVLWEVSERLMREAKSNSRKRFYFILSTTYELHFLHSSSFVFLILFSSLIFLILNNSRFHTTACFRGRALNFLQFHGSQPFLFLICQSGHQFLIFIRIKPQVLGFDAGSDYRQSPASPETSQEFSEQNDYRLEQLPYNVFSLLLCFCVRVYVFGYGGVKNRKVVRKNPHNSQNKRWLGKNSPCLTKTPSPKQCLG